MGRVFRQGPFPFIQEHRSESAHFVHREVSEIEQLPGQPRCVIKNRAIDLPCGALARSESERQPLTSIVLGLLAASHVHEAFRLVGRGIIPVRVVVVDGCDVDDDRRVLWDDDVFACGRSKDCIASGVTRNNISLKED